MNEPMSYKEAGVDIDKADAFVHSIRSLVKTTHRTGVIGEIGGFGGLFHLDVEKYRNPVLVSATDGVGTKIKIAVLMDRHHTIGIDLVAMCVNDIITCGAAPLFFLDYLAMGQLSPDTAIQIVEGITVGCRQARCSLIGGETAEMPGMYQPGDYDLAGFVVGVVEREHLIDGSDIAVGHCLIGLTASGLHSNGYSLVRRVLFEKHNYAVTDEIARSKRAPGGGAPQAHPHLRRHRAEPPPGLPYQRHLPHHRRRSLRQSAPHPAALLPGGDQ